MIKVEKYPCELKRTISHPKKVLPRAMRAVATMGPRHPNQHWRPVQRGIESGMPRKRCVVSLVEGGPPRSVSASAPYAPDQMQGVATHASSSVSRGVDLSQPVQACFSVNQTGTKPTGPAAPRLQPERVGPSQYVHASRMNATAIAPPTYA